MSGGEPGNVHNYIKSDGMVERFMTDMLDKMVEAGVDWEFSCHM